MGFDVLSIVQMIGGLALFIYGMTTMGKGSQGLKEMFRL